MKYKLPWHSRKLRNAAAPGPAAPVSRGFGAWRSSRWAILAAFIAAASPAIAQEDESDILEPQPVRLQISDAYLGVLVNGNFSQSSNAGQNGNSTYENLFIGPDIGLDASGSIYHPNFINFTLDGDIAPGYLTEKSTESGSPSSGNTGFALLGNYVVNINVLQEKPYRSTFYLNQNYSEVQDDFYNEIQVNSLRYGADLGYQSGPVPFTIEVWQQQQDTSGAVNENSTEHETALIFGASNKRSSGGTALNYALTDYTLSTIGGQGSGLDQAVSLNDSETFGGNQQFKLNSAANYSDGDNNADNEPSAGGRNQNFNATESFSIEHSPTLSSSYDVNYFYTNSNTPDGTEKSDGVNGDISLTHQLFDSLTSSLTLDGNYYDTTDSFPDDNSGQSNSGSQTAQFSGAITESYTKHLGPATDLTMTGSIIYQYTNQKDIGDSVLESNEVHTFSSSTDSFSLNLPDVDQGTIIVTNAQGMQPGYQNGIDYTISQNGSITMIRRTATSNIPQNSKVYVTYTAAASPSGHYETINGLVNLRIDFWNGLLGIYGRYNSLQNYGASIGNSPADSAQNGSPDFLAGLENVTEYAAGADATWHWLRGGLEYDDYSSTYASSSSLNLYQSLTFAPDSASSLSFTFNEAMVRYSTAGTNEQDYSFTTQYHRHVAGTLELDLDMGVELRRGVQEDETLAVLRPKLRYNIGQFSLNLGYSIEYSKYLNTDTTLQQFLFISARRSF